MATTASGIYYPGPGERPNGRIQMQALAESVEALAGGQRKGVEIATEQTTTSSAYNLLTTPDQVTGIVLPAKAFIRVTYLAQMYLNAAATANAAIHLGSNIVVPAKSNAATDTSFATMTTTLQWRWVTSYVNGMYVENAAGGNGEPINPVTTGQIQSVNFTTPATGVGGPCQIVAAPGTYSVNVSFKTSASTLRVRNRRLYVEVVKFS